MRGWSKGVVATAVVCLLVVAAPGSTVGAAGLRSLAVDQAVPGPTITVTPSTGLVDGQSVTVEGSGFSNDATMVEFFEISIPTAVRLGSAPVSGGSFSASVTVSRQVGLTDCAGATGGHVCVFVAGAGVYPEDEFATQVLSFLEVDTVPGTPTIIRNATAAARSATVSWTRPTFDGGSAITGYVVTPYIGFRPLPSVAFDATATTQVITGLTNGTTYWFRVQAVNAIGTSGYSKVTNPVTPASTVPNAPTIIRNATASDGEASVSWTTPVSDGGEAITGYVVTPYIGYLPLASVSFDATATTQVITGLTNGTTYRFRVQAVNAIGTGGYSKVTNPVTPTA